MQEKSKSDEQILASSWEELLEDMSDLKNSIMVRPDLLSKKFNDPLDPISGDDLGFLVDNLFAQISVGTTIYIKNKMALETSVVLAIEHAKNVDLPSGTIISAAFDGRFGVIPEYLVKYTLQALNSKTVKSDNPLENGRRVMDVENDCGVTPLCMALLVQQSSISVQLLLEYGVDVLSEHPFSLMAECIEKKHSPEELKEQLQSAAIELPNFHFVLAAGCCGGQCLPHDAVIDMVRQEQQQTNNKFDKLIYSENIAPIREFSKMMDLFSESRAVKSACEVLRRSGKDPLLELEMQLEKTTAQLQEWHKAGPQAMGKFFVEGAAEGGLQISQNGSPILLFTIAGIADIISKSKVLHEMVGEWRGAFHELATKVSRFRSQNVFVPSKIDRQRPAL